jgi:poly[(R)-3-hydroxyalkanoate] polymerase subunit PhaC
MTRPQHPDRRLAPRPLPAHLASAAALWLSSRSALPLLNGVSPRSSAAGKQLRALTAEIEALGPERLAGALDHEIARRAESCLAGLEAYRRHPYRRAGPAPPVLWREGTARLLDFGEDRAAPAVLIVPSLINRYYVLDLLPERSFLRHFARSGLRPLVIDWRAPGNAECALDLSGYSARLDRALAAAAEAAHGPIAMLGYCMGGLLAIAAALRDRCRVACLALLATPWDFHAGRGAAARLLALYGDRLIPAGRGNDGVPVELVQSFFFMIDPFLAERKFVRLSRLDPESDAARSFVALEDWINDGVPLGSAVARDCVRSWYRDNEPGRGVWQVAGRLVEPRLWHGPALVVIPGRDRIVSPSSAEPLAAAIRRAEVLRPAFGHVGMMAAARAPALLWTPIVQWLRAHM